jgi:predicted transcriptional regulator
MQESISMHQKSAVKESLMKKPKIKVSFTCILLILVTQLFGCISMNDVIRAKTEGAEGTTRLYQANSELSWEIARTVFRWEGTDAIEEHKDQGYMLTSSGMNLLSWGTLMGAWIEPVNEETTKVTVVTKRRMPLDFVTTLTEGTFHSRFEQALEIVKNGQPLPATPPEWNR